MYEKLYNCGILKQPIGLFEGANRVEVSSDIKDVEAQPDHSIHRPITFLISVPAQNTKYRARLLTQFDMVTEKKKNQQKNMSL